jgi:deoxyribonuclease-4
VLIGAHVPSGDPIAEAAARSAEVVQVFLSNPQSWRAPLERDDALELQHAGVPIFVHAPYLINVVSPNNRVRIPSRTILIDTVAASEAIGAAGVVVHGGHVTGDGTFEDGLERWRKALEVIESPIPVLIENTAGGDNAMARRVEHLARLWETIGDLGVGLCLDTCHAWASGERLDGLVGRVMAATGRVDLVHVNDSRDPIGSRRDRHANLGEGEIPPDQLIQVVVEARAPAVVETPGGADAQAADIAWIRSRL